MAFVSKKNRGYRELEDNMNKEMWTKIKNMLNKSEYKLDIFEGDVEKGQAECEELNISKDSVLECVVTNCNGICIDNWIRILGQESEEQHGVVYYNNLSEDDCLSGMLVVANNIEEAWIKRKQESEIKCSQYMT